MYLPLAVRSQGTLACYRLTATDAGLRCWAPRFFEAPTEGLEHALATPFVPSGQGLMVLDVDRKWMGLAVDQSDPLELSLRDGDRNHGSSVLRAVQAGAVTGLLLRTPLAEDEDTPTWLELRYPPFQDLDGFLDAHDRMANTLAPHVADGGIDALLRQQKVRRLPAAGWTVARYDPDLLLEGTGGWADFMAALDQRGLLPEDPELRQWGRALEPRFGDGQVETLVGATVARRRAQRLGDALTDSPGKPSRPRL